MRAHPPHTVWQLRSLFCALVACVILGIWLVSLPAEAQSPPKVFRVGLLASGARTPDGGPPRALREALRTLGYGEGQNIVYEARFADAMFERLPDLAAE